MLAAKKVDLTVLAGRSGVAEVHTAFPAGGGRLTQLLPVLDDEASALGLYFRVAGQPNGHLDIRLMRQPSGQEAAFWRVDAGALRDGLNVFEIGGVSEAANDELVLEIGWSADFQGVEAGMSSVHQDTAYHCDCPAMDVQQRSLAVEIWRGRNGGRQPRRLGGAESGLSQSYSQVENVPFDVLKRVREFKYEGSEQRDYPLIQTFGDRILVHPATTRPTLAYIPQRLPPGVRSVRIQCETRHNLASDIEYAMAIVSSAEGLSALFEGNAGAADGFSGWRRLQALEVQWLAVTLSEPVKSPHYIFLGTRLPEESSEAYGWATWCELQYVYGENIAFDNAVEESRHETSEPTISKVEVDASLAVAPPAPVNIRLDPESFASAAFHSYEQVAGYDPNSVRPVGEGLLLVHPRGFFPTIARIDGAVPAGSELITVDVRTIEDKASIIEYALAVVPAEMPPHEFFNVQSDAYAGFSGWTSVPPQIDTRLRLRLAEPASGNEILCLATRLRPGDTDMYCWSCFSAPVFNPDESDSAPAEGADGS